MEVLEATEKQPIQTAFALIWYQGGAFDHYVALVNRGNTCFCYDPGLLRILFTHY